MTLFKYLSNWGHIVFRQMGGYQTAKFFFSLQNVGLGLKLCSIFLAGGLSSTKSALEKKLLYTFFHNLTHKNTIAGC